MFSHICRLSLVLPPGVWRLATNGSSRPAAPKPPRALDGVWHLAVVANFLSRTVQHVFQPQENSCANIVCASVFFTHLCWESAVFLSCVFVSFQPINISSEKMPLEIEYSPISLGKLRIWTSLYQSLKMMKSLGRLHKSLNRLA